MGYEEAGQVDVPLSAWHRRLSERGRRLVRFMRPRKAKATELGDGQFAYERDDVVDADENNAVVIHGSDRLPDFRPHLQKDGVSTLRIRLTGDRRRGGERGPLGK